MSNIFRFGGVFEVVVDEPTGTPGLNELKALPKKEEPSNPPKEY